MAKLVLVEACSHSPFLYTEPHLWNEIRRRRPTTANVPMLTEEENKSQYERCMNAFGVLKQKMEEANPDVILIFGDDQLEQFDLNNFPQFAVYLGEEFEGYRTFPRSGIVPGSRGGWVEKTPETWQKVKNYPELARELILELTRRDFDVSFMMDVPNKEHGVGHAFMRPMHYIVPDYHIPVVPFYVNCYYGAQPTAERSYHLGEATREIIEAWDKDVRVAVIGSGGLWHTPGNPEAWLNEEFDQGTLAAVRSGSGKALAEHFDRAPRPHETPENTRWITGGTGLYTGLGSGTGETRNWVVAAGVADGTPGTIVDYVPVYAAPCGMGFAYWDV